MMKDAWLFCAALAACACAPAARGQAADAGTDAAVPVVRETLEITSGDFQVPPIEELTRCVYRPLAHDADFNVVRFEAHLLAGSHHMNFFYVPPEQIPDDLRDGDCMDLYRVFLMGSQWDDVDESLPDGLAIRVPAGSYILLESHFVNGGDDWMPARADVRLTGVNTAAVRQYAGVQMNVLEDLRVDPGEHVILRGRCDGYHGTRVFLLTSHMHHHGLAFRIALDNRRTGARTPIYESTEWDHPVIARFDDAPLAMVSGDGFEWECEYRNDTDRVVRGGGSAERDEMCIMAAFYAPLATPIPYCFAHAERIAP